MSDKSGDARIPVWCLEFPAQYGRFSPQGDHAGWKNAREQYFETQMSDSERAKFENRASVYLSEVSRKFNSNTNPILDHEWPEKFCLERDYKRLGSVIDTPNRVPLIEGALKELIEELEPDTHHFRSIRLLTRAGEIYPGDYHVMAIGQNLNGFDPEGSDPDSVEWSELYKVYRVNAAEGMAFSEAAVAGKHLWRDVGPLGHRICLSDKLVQEVKARGFLMPELIATKGYVA